MIANGKEMGEGGMWGAEMDTESPWLMKSGADKSHGDVVSGRQYMHDNMVPRSNALKALFIVYDADGTVCGEIIYHLRKTFFNGSCSACTITHGPKKEKPEFTQLKGGFSVPVYNIHRDEMHLELRNAARQLPCVVAQLDGEAYDQLLSPEELELADGSVQGLQRLLTEKLQQKGISTEDSLKSSLDECEGDARVPTFVEE